MKNLIVALFVFGVSLQLAYQKTPLHFKGDTYIAGGGTDHYEICKRGVGLIFAVQKEYVKWIAYTPNKDAALKNKEREIGKSVSVVEKHLVIKGEGE